MEALENVSYPFDEESDLDPLIDLAGEKRAVLIGGSTHGTSEFYTWRAKITQRLIKEKGFSFVTVEGDWPTCYQINRYVRGQLPDKSARDALSVFDRWPTWIWANEEVLDFIEWLAAYNKELPEDRKVGFYGLDLYGLWDSLTAAVNYMQGANPDIAKIARELYKCFEPHKQILDGHSWSITQVPESCQDEVTRFLSSLEHLPPAGAGLAAEEKLNAEQSALAAIDAERYFRNILRGDPEAWNLREEHMANTFFRLLNFYSRGFDAKGIVWAHNTHVGDARATDMAERTEVSIGQIVRDRLETEQTFLIGLGTYQGRVTSASDWDAPVQDMELPPAVYESWESVLHNFGRRNRMLLFSSGEGRISFFSELNGHRAIGVIFDPNAEFTNYLQAALGDSYDAFLYIDTTSALRPLSVEPKPGEVPDTYPSAS